MGVNAGVTAIPGTSDSDWAAAAVALTQRGYVVLPCAMSEGGWHRLRDEAEGLRDVGAFSVARIGYGDAAHKEDATRGGSVCWLDASMPAGQAFLCWMEGLRVSLNRDLFLGLDTFEAHYAHYPVGACYETHVDRHHRSNARVVSAVIYLNVDWPDDAGGELLIYASREASREAVHEASREAVHEAVHDDASHDAPQLTLSPRGGTLVLFMSDDTPHEAKKATRERWSIAGWFRTRD